MSENLEIYETSLSVFNDLIAEAKAQLDDCVTCRFQSPGVCLKFRHYELALAIAKAENEIIIIEDND